MKLGIAQRLKNLVTNSTNYTLGDRNAQIISVCAQKGGVGKTTSAVNLSYCLARFHNQKVLVIDLDGQGHVASSLGGVYGDGNPSLSEIMLADRGRDLMEMILPSKYTNLDIAPADRQLYETENILASKIGKEFVLKDTLTATRTHYDFIIIDCPPNMGNLTLNALTTSDYLLVPTDMSRLSSSGISELFCTVSLVSERLNRDLDILGILFTRVDGRTTRVNSAIEGELSRMFSDLILDTKISLNSDISCSQIEGKPIAFYAPNSRGSKNYQDLAKEVLERLGHENYQVPEPDHRLLDKTNCNHNLYGNLQ